MPRAKSKTAAERDSASKATRQAQAASQLPRHGASHYVHQDPGGQVSALDELVGSVLFDECIQFRFTPDREGQIWAKACIRTAAYPRHYLLTSHPPGTPFSTCLEGLIEKVQLFQEGRLKPSPDRWVE